MLDDSVVAFLKKIGAGSAPEAPIGDLESARQILDVRFRAYPPPVRPVERNETVSISANGGVFDALICWPNLKPDNELLPLLLWFHGGGWTLGSAAAQQGICRYLCAEAGIVVANIDYRLAPEWPFPSGSEDAYEALLWMISNAARLGINPTRISVGGASAGGHLAAVLAQTARDRGSAVIDFQALIYPCTSLRDEPLAYPSRARLGNGDYGVSMAEFEWLRGHFLPDMALADDLRASPALAADLFGLPDALIVTAEYDPLVDEGADYAQRLGEAGVAVEYQCVRGMIHGFVEVPGYFAQGQEILDLLAARLASRARTADMPVSAATSRPNGADR
jgi:acetyl esterase